MKAGARYGRLTGLITLAAGVFSAGGCNEGIGGALGVAGLFQQLGVSPPPVGALNPQQVVGGDDKTLVFVRQNLNLADLVLSGIAGDGNGTTDVAVVGTAGTTRRFHIPHALASPQSDGRWLAYVEPDNRQLRVLDLETGTESSPLVADGGLLLDVLAVDRGRALLRSDSGLSFSPGILLVDLVSREERELLAPRESYGAIAAIRESLVVIAYVRTPSESSPPFDPPRPAPQSGKGRRPETAESSVEALIEIVYLETGELRPISNESAYAVGITPGRVVWAAGGPVQGSDGDSHTIVRSFDLASGVTANLKEWTDSIDGGGFTAVAAIGAAGVLIQSAVMRPDGSRHSEELLGFDGKSRLIQAHEIDLQHPPYYDARPALIDQRIISRDPYTGDWFEFRGAGNAAATIEPF